MTRLTKQNPAPRCETEELEPPPVPELEHTATAETTNSLTPGTTSELREQNLPPSALKLDQSSPEREETKYPWAKDHDKVRNQHAVEHDSKHRDHTVKQTRYNSTAMKIMHTVYEGHKD
ncbi:hypothetical protein CsSME_00053135 [Camellia sinensis var. sinensis]